MLFITKVPLSCGRNNPQHGWHENGTSRIGVSGIQIMSAEKEFPGGNVLGTSYGVEQGDGGHFVFCSVEDLDSTTKTILSGPHSEQKAESLATEWASPAEIPVIDFDNLIALKATREAA